jgi:hypothetical protein
VQTGLARTGARPRKQLRRFERPVPAELAGKPFGRMVAALELSRTVGWDIRDDVCRRPLDVGDDELGSESRCSAEAVLLPRVHERPRRAGVCNRRARRGERQPPSGTFAAALDRPGRRRATARTAWRTEHPQLRVAGATHRVGSRATRDTTSGQDKVDEPHRPRYGRSCNVSVPTP